MIVLGLDTATSATAVALTLNDGRCLRARDDPPPGEHPGHATRLLGMAQDLLTEAALTWDAVERVAVGVGPGTFTGLRVGVATARALAQAIPAPLVGVSSLQALALGALASWREEPDGARVGALAVIDARRGEVFAAAYAMGIGAPRELSVPAALAPDALAATIEGASEIEPRPSRWIALGDGAVRYRELVERTGAEVPADGDARHAIDAGAICELGRSAPGGGVGDVVPDYRRRPDAELALRSAAASAAKP